MTQPGDYKTKFTRKYFGFNPVMQAGPTTNVLDTIVKEVKQAPIRNV